MSLLLEHGHHDASSYPVCQVWSEARLIRQRKTDDLRLDAIKMHTVVVDVLAGKKHLRKFLEELDDGY